LIAPEGDAEHDEGHHRIGETGDRSSHDHRGLEKAAPVLAPSHEEPHRRADEDRGKETGENPDDAGPELVPEIALQDDDDLLEDPAR
jgi:hypothetical protein